MSNLKYRLTDALLLLITSSLFAWGIVCTIADRVDFTPDYKGILFRVIIIILVLRIILINKYAAAVSLIIAVLTAGVTFITFSAELWFAETIQKSISFIHNLFLYIGGYNPYEPLYETVILWSLCGIVSLFSVVFAWVSFRFYALSGLTAVIFISALSSCGFSYGLPFLACMFCMLFFLVKYLGSKRPSKKSFSLNAAAIVLLCFCAAYFIPTPEKGFAGTVADTVIYKSVKAANKFIGDFFAPKYFSLSSAGYLKKDGRLGGDISLTDDAVLDVSLPVRFLDKPLYLAGAVKDKYTGYSWENTSPGNSPVYFSDDEPTVEFLEVMFSNLMISLNSGEFEEIAKVLENPEKLLETWYQNRCEYIPGGKLTLQMEQSVYKLKSAEINLRANKTYSVFSLSRTVGVGKEDGLLPVEKDGHGSLTAEKLLPKNSSYTIFYRADPSDLYWNGISNLSRRGIYKEMAETMRQLHEKYNFDKNQVSVLLDSSLDEDKANMHMFKMYPAGEEYFNPEISMNYEDLLTEVFIPRSEEIYERYTKLPDNFPRRIADLANDVTKDADSDYAKAKAISSFLRKYPYTLTPGEVPEDRDFVDYFLFDGQTGYCVYFASAFVTMCRAEGLPARYVEGYVTPLEKNDAGYYNVTNKQGHAWGEVYFEGYGWVQFEPTPVAASTGRPSELPTSEQYPLTQPETEAEPIREISHTADESADIPEAESADVISVIPEIQKLVSRSEKSAREIIIYNFLFSVLLFITAVTLFIYIRFLITRRKERKIGEKENNEAAALYFNMLLKYLKFFRREKNPRETVTQYADRIGGEFSFADESINMSGIAEIISRARYGRAQICDKDVEAVKRALKDIDETMRRSVGIARYIYYRYAARVI